MYETSESVRSLDPLIEAAVRPFRDNAEMRLAAGSFVERLIVPGHAGESGAAERWEAVDVSARRPWWRMGLWAALALLSLGVWLLGAGDMICYGRWAYWSWNPFGSQMPPRSERIAARLNEGQKLLLIADPEREFPDGPQEALWRSDPDNPAYFALYAASYVNENGQLPPDFLKTARRIDPENSWFTYYAVAAEAEHCVQEKPGARDAAGGSQWRILDPTRFDEALRLFHEARGQPGWENYASVLMRERMLPLPRGTQRDQLESMGLIVGASVFPGLRMMRLWSLVDARSEALAAAGEWLAFSELSQDAETLLRRQYEDDRAGTMLEELVLSASVTVAAKGLAEKAEALGVHEELERWQGIETRLQKRKEYLNAKSPAEQVRFEEAARHAGSLFGKITLAQLSRIADPPILTNEDLEPGRAMDHEILSRFFGYGVWLLMGGCLGLVALDQLRAARLVRRLARRMEELLRPVDWGWVLGAGVVLPFLYVMVVNRLTPLGGRELGMMGAAGLLPLAHFVGLLVLWWIVPVQVGRWRLALRAGCFGFTRPSWLAWVAVAGGFAFVPMIGWAVISGSYAGVWLDWVRELGIEVDVTDRSAGRFWWALGLLALPLLWLGIASAMALRGRNRRWLQRVTVSRILGVSCGFAMSLMMLAVPLFHVAEQRAFERERLMKFDPDLPAWSGYEYRVALQMRNETRDLLGFGD